MATLRPVTKTQMEALIREFADWCRESELDFEPRPEGSSISLERDEAEVFTAWKSGKSLFVHDEDHNGVYRMNSVGYSPFLENLPLDVKAALLHQIKHEVVLLCTGGRSRYVSNPRGACFGMKSVLGNPDEHKPLACF